MNASESPLSLTSVDRLKQFQNSFPTIHQNLMNAVTELVLETESTGIVDPVKASKLLIASIANANFRSDRRRRRRSEGAFSEKIDPSSSKCPPKSESNSSSAFDANRERQQALITTSTTGSTNSAPQNGHKMLEPSRPNRRMHFVLSGSEPMSKTEMDRYETMPFLPEIPSLGGKACSRSNTRETDARKGTTPLYASVSPHHTTETEDEFDAPREMVETEDEFDSPRHTNETEDEFDKVRSPYFPNNMAAQPDQIVPHFGQSILRRKPVLSNMASSAEPASSSVISRNRTASNFPSPPRPAIIGKKRRANDGVAERVSLRRSKRIQMRRDRQSGATGDSASSGS